MGFSMRAVQALAVVLLMSGVAVADDAADKAAKQSDGTARTAAADSTADASATKAADAEAKPARGAQARQVRLTKPWSGLASLSDEQKRQINQIHRKAVAEKRAVDKRERDDIMALLNDQQKAELTAMEEKQEAARKTKAAAQKSATSDAKAVSGDTAATASESAASKKDAAGAARN